MGMWSCRTHTHLFQFISQITVADDQFKKPGVNFYHIVNSWKKSVRPFWASGVLREHAQQRGWVHACSQVGRREGGTSQIARALRERPWPPGGCPRATEVTAASGSPLPWRNFRTQLWSFCVSPDFPGCGLLPQAFCMPSVFCCPPGDIMLWHTLWPWCISPD